MKIIFIGCSKSSEALLKKCLHLKLNIVGVCTKQSSWNSDFCNLKEKFINNNIPFFYSQNINSDKSLKWIKNKNPDLIFCFGWSELLKKKILKLAKIASVGFHPTKLPQNKGRHPIIWTIALGLKKTASTFFLIQNEKADTGKIISQKKIIIKKNETSSSLYKKIITISKKQLVEVIDFFKKKKGKEKINNFSKNKNENVWRKRNVLDGKIDWRMSASAIDRLIKSLYYPYNYAHFCYNNKIIKVKDCKVISKKNNKNNSNFEPGKILIVKKNSFDIKCGEGVIRIIKIDKKINFKKVYYL